MPVFPPVAIHGDPPKPPAAWLLVDGQRIPASWGTYSYGDVCADYADPQNNPEIIAVRVMKGDSLILIIQSPDVHELQALTYPWRRQGPRTDILCPVTPQRQDSPDFSAFMLGLPPAVDDRILDAHAWFPLGDATYHWRLNPPG
jgi:hypothetical protein